MVALKAVYAANVLVAGTVGSLSLFAPALASRVVFEGTATASSAMQTTGALWLAIALLSAAGLRDPQAMVPILLLQLIYKAAWLAVVALPALVAGRMETIPVGMAAFFAVWVAVLPFVIPWTRLLPGSSA